MNAPTRIVLLGLVFLAGHIHHVSAQPTCPFDSAATEYLAANGVTARLAASNVQFWFHEYEAPAGSNVRTLVFASTMLGGQINGDLRIIASWISDEQMQPGPLYQDGNPPPDCRPFNKVFKVTLADILEYEETGVANDALADWPWQLGAPVEDGDGIEGNYDLGAGDRPFVEGHEKLWWILNDVGVPSHLPLGVEVQTSAFALASDDPALDYATFYRYHITYRGDAPLTDAYFGMQMFTALGETDNYLGSDTTLGLAYVYNGDDFDESGRLFGGYGDRPAAFGVAILDGVLVDSDQIDNDGDGLVDEEDERLPMTTVLDWQPLDPRSPADYYGYMQGYWSDGRHLTVGGSGRGFSEIETNFQYPGEPGTFWSEEDVDGYGTSSTPDQVHLVWSTGPLSMEVGESRDIVVAMLWAQGEDRYDSVRLLKESVPKVRNYYANGFDNLASSAPSTAPALYAPANGAEGQPNFLRLSWAKQPNHQRHEVFVSRDPDFSEVVDTSGLANPSVSFDLSADATYYWKVRGTNSVGKGPWSDTWSFSTGSVKQVGPGPLEIDGSGEYAFIQIEGPEGENDACNSLAESRLGCDEVGGNGVYVSPNGAVSWLMGYNGEGPEFSIGRFAPRDYELRFTAGGSYAYQQDGESRAFLVPFEAWDIGPTGPFGVNDPVDDVQLIPGITAGFEGDCRFGFGDNPSSVGVSINHHNWPATEAIDAYYPSEGSAYTDWSALVEPLVSSEDCPQAQFATGLIDSTRRPLQNILFLMDTTASSFRAEGIPTGNVIRFLTTRPNPPILSAPADESSILHRADPNGLSLWWQLPPGTRKSRLQITKVTPVSRMVVDSVVVGSTFTLQDPELGLYTWRVGYLTEADYWSEPWSFDVFSIASTENELAEFPAVLTLRQPYPNPTSGQTHFDIGLPSADRITLTAFDLLGRRVATIADTPMTAGWRTIDWNTSSFSNGVYVVRLAAGKTAVTTKVVVVR